MKSEDIRIQNNRDQELAGRLYRTSRPGASCVIYSHGLFSSKDAYKINRIAADVVNTGHALLTFDFSFSGENAHRVSELSIVQEVEDLRCVVRFACDRGYSSLHLMGSSMGGVVSLLFAADPGDAVLDSMIIIATPVHLTDILAGSHGVNIDSLPEGGYTPVDGIPLTNRFFRELKSIDMTEAVSRIEVPVLIFHGALDSVVPAVNAGILESLLKGDKKVVIIDDGDHNLTRESDIELLRRYVVEWLTGRA